MYPRTTNSATVIGNRGHKGLSIEDAGTAIARRLINVLMLLSDFEICIGIFNYILTSTLQTIFTSLWHITFIGIMVFSRYPPPKRLQIPGAYQPDQPDVQLAWKKADDQIRTSDKDLLNTGYMSDCTIICADSKWATHKSILCSRNDWFRVALTGDPKEGLPGVLEIEDTNPDVVQIVLEAIYTGEINWYCTTPSDVVAVWKAGDFFGICDLCWEAENAMFRRLKASAGFLSFNTKPSTKPREDRHCKIITFIHEVCGHYLQRQRVCPVSRLQGNAVFRLREPISFDNRYDTCVLCEKRMKNESELDRYLRREREAAEQHSRRFEPPFESPLPDGKARELIISEIQDLCEALNIALADTPKGSRIHDVLLNHVCNTPVAAWWGFTVCKFLEKKI